MSRDFSAHYFYRLTASLLDIGEPFTLSCFFNLDDTKHQDFLSKYNGSSWIMGTYTGGQLGGYNGAWVVAPTALTVGRTYHVAWVCAGGTGTLYQDGVAVASGGSGSQGAVASNFHIGVRAGPAQYMDGRIAEVGIWTAALNAREVAGLAKGVNPRNVRWISLRAYYPIWGIAAPEVDLSTTKLHLTTGALPAAARHIAGGPMVL